MSSGMNPQDRLLSEAILKDLGNGCSLCYYFLEQAEEHQMFDDDNEAVQISESVFKIAYHYKHESELLLKIFDVDLSQSMDLTIAFRESNITLLSLRTLFRLFGGDKLFTETVQKSCASSITALLNLENVDEEVIAMQLMITCKDILTKYHQKLQKIHESLKASSSSSSATSKYSLFVKGFGSVFALFAHRLATHFPKPPEDQHNNNDDESDVSYKSSSSKKSKKKESKATKSSSSGLPMSSSHDVIASTNSSNSDLLKLSRSASSSSTKGVTSSDSSSSSVNLSSNSFDHHFNLLCSIYFLRFISPIIISQSFQSLFLKKNITKTQRVYFVYLTKLMQAIANNQKDQHIIPNLSKRYLRSFITKSHSIVKSIVNIMLTSSPAVASLSISNFSVDHKNQKYLHYRVEPSSRFRLDENLGLLSTSYADRNKIPENIWLPSCHFIRPSYSNSAEMEVQKFKKEIRLHQKRTYGFVLAPLEPHCVIPPLFGILWSLQYEIASVNYKVDPVCKEIIQVVVSAINRCNLCVDLHTTAAMSMGMSYKTIDRLIHDREPTKKSKNDSSENMVTDKMRALVKWALVSNQKGHPLLQSPPFTKDEAPEVMGAAVLKHYFNRITNTFLKVFTHAKGSFWKSKMFQRKAESIRSAKTRFRFPSHSLLFAASLDIKTDLPYLEMFYHFIDDPISMSSSSSSLSAHLTASPLSSSSSVDSNLSSFDLHSDYPILTMIDIENAEFNHHHHQNDEQQFNEYERLTDLELKAIEKTKRIIEEGKGGWRGNIDPAFEWAQTNPIISEILYRWQTFEEQLVKECLPPNVLVVLHDIIDNWDGTSKISRDQINHMIRDLSSSEQIMARLTLSIAHDPTRVSSHLTNQFLTLFPANLGSQYLIGACSYAVFYATKHIASFWNV